MTKELLFLIKKCISVKEKQKLTEIPCGIYRLFYGEYIYIYIYVKCDDYHELYGGRRFGLVTKK